MLILTIIKHLQNVMRQANFARIYLHKFVFPPPSTLGFTYFDKSHDLEIIFQLGGNTGTLRLPKLGP